MSGWDLFFRIVLVIVSALAMSTFLLLALFLLLWGIPRLVSAPRRWLDERREERDLRTWRKAKVVYEMSLKRAEHHHRLSLVAETEKDAIRHCGLRDVEERIAEFYEKEYLPIGTHYTRAQRKLIERDHRNTFTLPSREI